MSRHDFVNNTFHLNILYNLNFCNKSADRMKGNENETMSLLLLIPLIRVCRQNIQHWSQYIQMYAL